MRLIAKIFCFSLIFCPAAMAETEENADAGTFTGVYFTESVPAGLTDPDRPLPVAAAEAVSQIEPAAGDTVQTSEPSEQMSTIPSAQQTMRPDQKSRP